MVNYRAYVMDREGRIALADWLDSNDDATALRDARALCSESRPMVDVWQGSRRVGAVFNNPERRLLPMAV